MSIAALSSAFASQVRRTAASALSATTPVEPLASAPRIAREHGRRHELVAAMNQALGVEPAVGADDRRTEQSVWRFAHALMHDLRTAAGQDGDEPPAWGRRDWGDLSQRLQALASAADTPKAGVPIPEVPDEPHPLTTTTAAVHIMKVPSSRLLEAFVSMQRALDQEGDALQADSDAARAALAELVRRLASGMAPAASASATLPAGSVLDVSA